uniref:Cytochrome P450 76C4-2 n=1 Tax=Isatis tinctoria TaxID=161756 RepID=A0A8F0FRT0_ISATI|nr:cytochrome P450 76C4-2 [Isatis tinctoria]
MDIISGQALFFMFCFILPCLLLFSTTRFKQGSLRSTTPPGPPRLPIIGNIHQVGKNPHQSFANLSKTYGPIMSLKFGSLKTVVITSPEAAREVLKTHDQVLSGRYFNEAVRSINHHKVSLAFLPSSSAHWRLLRKISATQLFSLQRIEATKALRMKKVRELVSFMNESSKRQEAVDISRASFVTVLNIISNMLFSVDLGSYDSEKPSLFQDDVKGIMESIGKPDLANFFPFLRFLDLQGNKKKMKDYSDRLFRVFRGFIDAKVAEKSSRSDPKNISESDFVDALIDLNKGDEAELNSTEIEHLLADLFVAGTDTNSSTLEWAMTELLRNPKEMVKAQAEIDRVIGQKGVVEESDISGMPYLQAVVKETFRLHPAGPLLVPRKAESDAEVLGYMVTKGTQVLVNVWSIGRDPSVWENPTRFEPERFLGKEIDVRGRDYELTPFGSGRRICPGLPLAVKIVPLVLASLLYSFNSKLPNGIVPEDLDMDETFGLSLHKTTPLQAVPVKKRNIDKKKKSEINREVFRN